MKDKNINKNGGNFGYKPKTLPDAGHSPKEKKDIKPPKGETGQSN